MAAITFKAFRGEVPRTSSRLLSANFASRAENIKLTSGRLDPLKGLQVAHTSLADEIRTIWRYRCTREDRTFDDNWLVFPGDVDVVGSMIANDADGRVYYTSDQHEPRMTIYAEAISGSGPYPDGWFALGIPLPTVAPTVVADVSSGTVTTAVANTPSAGKVTVTINTTESLQAGDTVVFAGVVGMTDLNASLVVESVSGLDVVFPLVTSQTYTSGGTWSRPGVTVTRGYAYTFVTPLGEESGPSPASAIKSGLSSGEWSLSNLQTAPPNSGTVSAVANNTPAAGQVTVTLDSAFGLAAFDTITLASVGGMTDLNGSHRLVSVSGNDVVVSLVTAQVYTSGGTWERNAPINTTGMTKRIYRTAGTGANFLFVDEIPVANTTYSDTSVVTLGEVIQTADHLPPPKNATSMITLPNGCTVVLAGNEVCFSVPYQPHSYPVSNRYSFVGRGVALSPAGNSVIVLTDGYPILLTGTDPEAMSPSVMQTYAPCVSKRGVVYIGGGCLYPSHDGLYMATPSEVSNITSRLFRESEWRSVGPETFEAAFHDFQYYAVGTPVGANRGRIMVLDIKEMDSVNYVDEEATDLLRNDYDGRLYLLKGRDILRWDANDNSRYLGDWISAEVQLDQPRNFSIAQVHARFQAVTPVDTTILDANTILMGQGPDAVNGHLCGTEILNLEVCGSFLGLVPESTERQVQFTLYDRDTPIFTTPVNSSRPFRLPAGIKTEVVRVGISSSVGVFSATIAESTPELAQASQ